MPSYYKDAAFLGNCPKGPNLTSFFFTKGRMLICIDCPKGQLHHDVECLQ